MKRFLSLVECLSLKPVDRNYYDTLNMPNPSTSNIPGASMLPSMSSIYGNLNFPTSVNDIGGSAATEANGLNNGTTGAFNTYMNYASGLSNPTDQYNTLLKQNGIPQLQQTSENLQGNINNLQNSLYNITPNVTANTGNSLVTDSQRQGMITNQSLPIQKLLEPLSSNLGQVNTSLATQEQNIGNEVNAQNTYNSQMLGAAGMGVTVAQDNAARSMTGFTTDESNTLSMLNAKLAAQQNLDNNEWQTLSTLAGKQQDYQNALGQISAQTTATNKLTQNQYTSVNGQLINLTNGQIVNPAVLAAKGSYTPPTYHP